MFTASVLELDVMPDADFHCVVSISKGVWLLRLAVAFRTSFCTDCLMFVKEQFQGLSLKNDGRELKFPVPAVS